MELAVQWARRQALRPTFQSFVVMGARSAQESSSNGATSGVPVLFSRDQGPRAAFRHCSQAAVMSRASGVLSGIWRQLGETGTLLRLRLRQAELKWANLNSAQFIVKVLLLLLWEKHSVASRRNLITHRPVWHGNSPSTCPSACWPFAFFSSASTDNRIKFLTIVYSDTDKSELGKGRIREAKDVVWNEAVILPAAPQARMAAYLEYCNLSAKDSRRLWTGQCCHSPGMLRLRTIVHFCSGTVGELRRASGRSHLSEKRAAAASTFNRKKHEDRESPH